MGSPESEVVIPDWLEDAMKPLLSQGADRYGNFARQGEQRVGDDFWRNNARRVVGPSQGERRAMRISNRLNNIGSGLEREALQSIRGSAKTNPFLEMAGNLMTGGEGSSLAESNRLLRDAGDISNEQVTGKNLGADPAIAQAQAQFSSAMLPMIQNQAALAGLGRSTAMTNAASAGQAQYMLPLIQGGLQREERGIDRRRSDRMERAGQLFGRDMSRASSLMSRGRGDQDVKFRRGTALQNIGGEKYNRALQQIGALQQQGSNMRGIRQERNDARFNDVMRRFGAYENALQGPMSMVGGMMGSRTNKF